VPAGQEEGGRVGFVWEVAGVPSSGVESLGVVEGSAVEDAGDAALVAAACRVEAEMEKALNAEGTAAEETGCRRAEARRRQVLQIMVNWWTTFVGEGCRS